MATPHFICANWNPESTQCKKTGIYSCKNCLLLLYCGPECQQSHWPLHKADCKSPLGKPTWKPDWALGKRIPAFVGPGLAEHFGGQKYLWGNVPALDVLQLEFNEGEDYTGPLRLLFAASGDLRNVAKTIAQLPSGYSGSVETTVNDKDFDVVARNAIMLLVALVIDNVDEAVDCIIHVWYSALIRKSDLDILQQRIRPLIENVCGRIKGKTPNSLLGKKWEFGQRSLQLVLEKSCWDRLLFFMDVPDGLTENRARQIRAAVTAAGSRKDYRERHLLYQSASRRIAKQRFWDDGLLLPFGARRKDFQEPNPTFFRTPDTWPMHDNAHPLNGWSSKDVADCSTGAATADIYGKLFYHVRAVLGAFLVRLRGLRTTFRLFQMDATSLPMVLNSGSFDRIEVSNISDGGYLGIHRTLGLMVPLLQDPDANPHATLITLFMNAVDECTTTADHMADMTADSVTTKRACEYLPFKTGMSSDDPDVWPVKFFLARHIVADHEHIFDRFMKEVKFAEAGQFMGAAVKETHTVIEKWPFRLKLRPGEPGAKEEFDRVLSGGVVGKERYVEWKRTAMPEGKVVGSGLLGSGWEFLRATGASGCGSM